MAAREPTHVEHSCHSTYNQTQTRIQEFLGDESGDTNPVMRSHRLIQSDSDSPQCSMNKCLPRDSTDKEVNFTKKDHLTELTEEQLAFYLKDIEQRFTDLDQREISLINLLKERHEEFEMEKIVVEREIIHEKMEWDRCVQEKEAAFISSVRSVMIKREKVMEELRKRAGREVRRVTLYANSYLYSAVTFIMFTHFSLCSKSLSMRSCLKHQSSSNTNYSGTRRKWWTFRKFGINIPRRV